jgi:hypothetical protein
VPTITLKMDQALVTKMDERAATLGKTRSEWLRSVIEWAVTRDVPTDKPARVTTARERQTSEPTAARRVPRTSPVTAQPTRDVPTFFKKGAKL